MKVKLSKNRAGETLVDYLNVRDKNSFRFHLLEKVIECNHNNAVIFVDTNQRVTEKSGLDILEELRQAGQDPMAVKMPANPQKFFGLEVNMWNKGVVEYMIVLELKKRPFTKEIFDPISGCDITVGINQTEPIQNQFGIVGTNTVLLLDSCFEKKLYDSILCTRIKSNLDISAYIKEVIHEMGL